MSSSPASSPASSPSSPALSQTSTKLGPESSMSLEDSKTLRRRAVERVQHAATAQDILLFLIAFRILNALSIKTFFQPDEFFQSLEPAWEIAFGANSGAWITWEWKNQLRSSIHPVLFATVYWTTSLVSCIFRLPPTWHADLMIAAPKITQAGFAALGDYYTWKLGERVYGQGSNEAWAALALTVCSPWQWFCSTRTFSNCLETSMTIAALNFWPWQWSMAPQEEEELDDESIRQSAGVDHSDEMGMSAIGFWDQVMHIVDLQWSLRRCLFLAAIACILRPTNILIWMCVACFALFRVITYGKMIHLPWDGAALWMHVSDLTLFPATKQERYTLVRESFICGALALVLSIICDRHYYGFFTFPPLRFLYFNIAQSLAVFYGRNRVDYYLTEGLPLLLTTYLPFALAGIYGALFPPDHPPHYSTTSPTTRSITNQLATTCLLVPTILSLIAHKEVRFIYPLLPLLHILASAPFTTFFLPAISPALPQPQWYRNPRRLLLYILLTTNITIALLTTTSHQPAPLNLLSYLRTQHTTHYLTQPPQAAHLPPAPSTMTVGFLMPCHSTPWRSHLVFPSIKAWALSCDPPVNLNASAKTHYLDEADRFYASPLAFLATTLGPPPQPSPATASWFSFSGWFGTTTPGFGRDDLLQVKDVGWDGRPGKKVWPEYLAFFQQMEPTMRSLLRGSAYHECWRGWNSWGHDDWRRRGDVVVWCQRRQERGRRKGVLGRVVWW